MSEVIQPEEPKNMAGPPAAAAREETAPVFSMQSIYSLPDLKTGATATKEFEARGLRLPLTARADAENDGEFWHGLIACLEVEAKPKPLWAHLPPPSTTKITFSTPAMISKIKLMQAAIVTPKLSMEEAIVLAYKLGPKATDKITDWILDVNGMTSYFQEKIAHLKNAGSVEDCA